MERKSCVFRFFRGIFFCGRHAPVLTYGRGKGADIVIDDKYEMKLIFLGGGF